MLPISNVFRLLMLILVVVLIADFGVVVPQENPPCDATKVTKRFKMFDDKKLNWIAAQLSCARHMMTLASIETSEEQAQVASALQTSSCRNSFWIGGTTQHGSDEFAWLSTGHPIETFANWAYDEPKPYPSECIVVGRKSFRWYTDHCNRIGPYVCQYFEANC